MTKFNNSEGKMIRFGIVIFWTLFWLLNVIDKFIAGPTFLWVGKDRFVQFINYFSSIGIEDPNITFSFLIFVTIAEIIAFIFATMALWHLSRRNEKKAHKLFFWGIIVSLFIFTFFSIGDQIFGDRAELLEHTIFWTSLIVSWGAYVYFSKDRKLKSS